MPSLENKNRLKIRKIGYQNFLIMDPETLFWVVHDKPEIPNRLRYSNDLKKRLETCIFKSHHKQIIELFELHLTEECNLNCNYCYIPHKLRKNKSYMRFEEAKSVINKCIKYS